MIKHKTINKTSNIILVLKWLYKQWSETKKSVLPSFTEGFPSAILVIYDNNWCSASLFFESDSKL